MCRDGHPFQQRIRVQLGDHPIDVSARIPLVEIRDNVPGSAGLGCDNPPLLPGRKPRSTPAAKLGRLNLVNNLFRWPDQRPFECDQSSADAILIQSQGATCGDALEHDGPAAMRFGKRLALIAA
jgi:hypothetical protein